MRRGICSIRVEVASVTEHSDAMYSLIQTQLSNDSWVELGGTWCGGVLSQRLQDSIDKFADITRFDPRTGELSVVVGVEQDELWD